MFGSWHSGENPQRDEEWGETELMGLRVHFRLVALQRNLSPLQPICIKKMYFLQKLIPSEIFDHFFKKVGPQYPDIFAVG